MCVCVNVCGGGGNWGRRSVRQTFHISLNLGLFSSAPAVLLQPRAWSLEPGAWSLEPTVLNGRGALGTGAVMHEGTLTKSLSLFIIVVRGVAWRGVAWALYMHGR